MRSPILIALSLFACQTGSTKVCTDLAAASALVSVTDLDGQSLHQPTVQYVVNGKTETCDALTRTDFACGWDLPGPMTIRVDADGYQAQQVEIEVEDGTCNVQTKTLQVNLEPVSCTEEMVPSIQLTVVDDISGAPVPEAEASYVPEGVDWFAPEPCDFWDGSFYCGYEWAGNIDIFVEAPDYMFASETIFVPADECHVITQVVQVPLESLLD